MRAGARHPAAVALRCGRKAAASTWAAQLPPCGATRSGSAAAAGGMPHHTSLLCRQTAAHGALAVCEMHTCLLSVALPGICMQEFPSLVYNMLV